MEFEGNGEHDDFTSGLLQEEPLPLTAVPEPIPSVSVSIPPSMSISQSAVNPDLSQPSLVLSPAVDAEIQARFAKLRAGSQTAPKTSAGFSFGRNSFGQRKGVIKII